MKRRPSKLIVAIATLLVAAGAGLVFTYWATYRQVPFDGAVWRTSPVKSLAKYRMSRDLLGKIKSERWTAGQTVAALGPDDSGFAAIRTGEVTHLSYRFRIPVQPTNEILRLAFDKNGQLLDARIVDD